MTYKEDEVYLACKTIAPAFGFDPKLVMAICKQECEHRVIDPDGKFRFHPELFRADKARLEQNYYDKYVERQNELATTTEGLFALSWGVMQMMGLSLKECGFFQWWFSQQPGALQVFVQNPLSDVAVVKALNWYVVNLEAMIQWGCKWLTKKKELAHGDERLMLTYWNGSSSYPDKIYQQMELIK